jgi:hypothetical protein
MKLSPKSPPGRQNRKARAFSDEIARLRNEGYTCDAIREALADAGVLVSKSTVQRELARPSSKSPTRTPASNGTDFQQSVPPTPGSSFSGALADASRSGKDIAEGFVKGRITNPLIRTRSVT